MRIVTLGGGTGQATVLRGLRTYDCQLTAIVGVTDNGGHSGQLRHVLRMPQVGDTRQCLGALVDDPMLWEPLLQHRFTEGVLEGAKLEGTYHETALGVARRAWLERMRREHHSAAVFSRLLPQLMEAEATLDFKMATLRMSMDELRHAALAVSG